jgi:pimeloyl-ACP methyl ester carboxylesterase
LGLPLIAAQGDAKPIKKTIRAEDGLSIIGEVRGKGDTALIFLHGWCGDREYWKHQVDVFAPNYRIVAVDQAGHGESGKDRKVWSVSAMAADVEAVVKALDLKRVILIGHSMGGPVALLAAKRMPGTVVAVIGVDTLQNAEMKMPEEARKRFMEAFEADFKDTMRTGISGLLTEKTDPDLKNWLIARAEAQDQKTSCATSTASMSRSFYRMPGRRSVVSTPAAVLSSLCLRRSTSTRNTPTTTRSSSKASAITRCWRSQPSSIKNSSGS